MTRWTFFMAIVSIAMSFLSCSLPPEDLDVWITNGTVYDGSGRVGVQKNIGIKDGRIVYIGTAKKAVAERVIDAAGLAVSPGFIDLHTHAERGALDLPTVDNYIRQGVTTVIGGNCGGSPHPLDEFMDRVDSAGLSLNLVLLVGHNTVRREVMGTENRGATPEEMEAMKSLVAEAMEAGAFGLSTGLKYIPGAYASTEEVIALSRVAAEHGGLYATHMRDEGLEILDAVRETIEIGRQAGIPTHISHHKIVGKTMWGGSRETLRLMEEARAQGVDVTFDQYPYTATSTGLTVLFPRWALADGNEAIKKRLRDRKTRAEIKEGIVSNIEKDRGGGDPANVVVTRFPVNPAYNGKNLAEITRLRGWSATIPNAAETLMDLVYEGGGSAIYHCLSEEDVERIMQDPHGTIGSDGVTTVFGRGVLHPRSYGTFPRVLGRYVREKGVLTLEEAVAKMTSRPADRLGLSDRGRIEKGAWADIVVFDPETVIDRATFLEPHQYPEGIFYVFVNGVLVADGDGVTGERPSGVLRMNR